jgi:hypothetical protein
MCSIFWTICLTNMERFTNFRDIQLNPMKNSLLHIVLIFIFSTVPFSCKKYIEQQAENAIVELVTNGKWKVTGYYDHKTVNLTDSFAGYLFQFNKNNTVYAVWNSQQANGTWSVDVSKKSITSTFPAATYPVTLLNYTWTITDSYTDSVAAKTPIDSSFNILNLHKN